MRLGFVNLPATFGFVVFALSIPLFYLSLRRKESSLGEFSLGISYKDLYTFILFMVPLTACISYLVMSFGYGSAVFNGNIVFWIRYFEWSITTPILVMGVMILSRDYADTLNVMVADFFMILTGFLATVSLGGFKIFYFGLSTSLFGYIVYYMIQGLGREEFGRPETIRKVFVKLRNWIISVWTFYPITWFLSSDEIGVLSFYGRNVVFTVLDLFAKIGFAYIVLSSFGEVEEIDVGMEFGEE